MISARRRWSRGVFGLFLSLSAVGFCPAQPTSQPQIPRFVNITSPSGVDFVFSSGETIHKRYLFEAKGGGLGFFDYDNDGWMDLLLVQGSTVPEFRSGAVKRAALYRNRGDCTFEEVSEKAALSYTGWGMGVTFGDYDNDGDADVYITNLVENSLFRNEGDGTFVDVTEAAGVGDSKWSASAAFGDYDADGDLDLYVSNYIDMDLANPPEPGSAANCFYRGEPGMCGPVGMKGAPNTLYRNNGDGTFSDVTQEVRGDGPVPYFSLGVVWADLDNDSDLDLFVGNDSAPNQVLINDGEGRFEDQAFLTGLAVSSDGRFQASMGVDVADYDNDGLMDLFTTHFANDYSTLYHHVSGLLFEDVSHEAHLVQPEWLLVSWGTRFVDLDHDGWKDLVHSNGHIYPFLDTIGWTEKYYQPLSLYMNQRDGTFLDAAKQAGPDVQAETLGRGMAFADIDNDGDMDFAVANLHDKPSLFRNELSNGRHWILFETRGTVSNRDGMGVRITLTSGGLTQMWDVRRAASIYSASDPRAHFGLGQATEAERVEVRWPSGKIQEFKDVPANRIYLVDEEEGLSVRP